MHENLDVKNTLNTIIEVPVLDEIENKPKKNDKIYATGRRKEAVARLWLSFGNGMQVNKKPFADYFSEADVFNILAPLNLIESLKGELAIKILATVKGGGIRAQADALKLALARALNEFDSSFRALLKPEGFLTRDARKKEREHYGFRTSRKPQQYKRR